jgi:Tfp pilus assembly protein PilN
MTIFSINLIAAKRRQKQHAVALLRVGIYTLIALALGVGMIYGQMTTRVEQVKGEIAQVEGELTSPELAESVARIQFLEQQTKELAPRVQLLEKVHSSESEWIRILQDISSCIPSNVWIGQLDSQRNDKNQTVSLRGKAFTQRDIGAFMLELDQPYWSAVPALGYSQVRSDPKTGAIVEFEITVPLHYVIGSELK